mmetsp:Transcript_12039/g.18587  ORF Transcript_12039/g.18587 Transcript_12039/m.18587 type:complete len:98 (-) Transcript_12039:1707-2000(-)
MFAGEVYLKKHYQKKHPEADFAADYPSKEVVKAEKQASQSEMMAKQREEQAKLFEQMKANMMKELSQSIGNLQTDISQIRTEQAKIENVGKMSESEH